MNKEIFNHYNEKYFNDFQKKIGLRNYRLKKRFSEFITNESVVLDFGCGGGYLLDSLECKRKIGYDVNKTALKNLKHLGIESCYDLSDIENNSIDVVISNSCLEHVPSPSDSLQILKSKLKSGGKIIVSVPHETINWRYKEGDVNYHLHTWSPMAIGNLFHFVGFKITKVKIFREVSLPKENSISKIFPEPILKPLRSLYRLFRILLDELNIKRICVDGNIVIYAVNS